MDSTDCAQVVGGQGRGSPVCRRARHVLGAGPFGELSAREQLSPGPRAGWPAAVPPTALPWPPGPLHACAPALPGAERAASPQGSHGAGGHALSRQRLGRGVGRACRPSIVMEAGVRAVAVLFTFLQLVGIIASETYRNTEAGPHFAGVPLGGQLQSVDSYERSARTLSAQTRGRSNHRRPRNVEQKWLDVHHRLAREVQSRDLNNGWDVIFYGDGIFESTRQGQYVGVRSTLGALRWHVLRCAKNLSHMPAQGDHDGELVVRVSEDARRMGQGVPVEAVQYTCTSYSRCAN